MVSGKLFDHEKTIVKNAKGSTRYLLSIACVQLVSDPFL